MQKKTVKVFEFEELKPEIQKKVIEKFRDINVDYYWYQVTFWNFDDKLKELGYTNIEPHYSGFGSQGDGACFTASVDIPAWLKAHKLGNKYRALAQAYMDGNAEIKITHNWRYYFATSTNVEPDDYRASEKAQAQMAEVVALIEKEREDLGNELYRELQDEYFSRIEDDAIKETVVESEMLFRADGAVFNEDN